jgi:hypothetical protein
MTRAAPVNVTHHPCRPVFSTLFIRDAPQMNSWGSAGTGGGLRQRTEERIRMDGRTGHKRSLATQARRPGLQAAICSI